MKTLAVRVPRGPDAQHKSPENCERKQQTHPYLQPHHITVRAQGVSGLWGFDARVNLRVS